MIRNQQMLTNYADIRLVVAFPGGKGTANMIAFAQKVGKAVLIVDPETD